MTAYAYLPERKHWDTLPHELDDTPAMRTAMDTLNQFSEKEKNYHLYQTRQNYQREESTRKALLEQALRREEEALLREEAAVQRKEAAVQQKEAAVQCEKAERQQKEAALAEQARLRELLRKAGIDADDA
jgi:hypothetical protein